MSAFFLFCASIALFSNLGYPAADNCLALTQTVGLSRTVHSYQYECAASLEQSGKDKLRCLTGADYRSTGLTAGSSGESFAYGYDPVGNPVSLRFAGQAVAPSRLAP